MKGVAEQEQGWGLRPLYIVVEPLANGDENLSVASGANHIAP